MLSPWLTGFCLARVATLVLRVAGANKQHSTRLAIAAQIFLNLGILIIYIVNLILGQQILRSKQPYIGWNPVVRTAYKILYILIGAAVAVVITSVVLSAYTLDAHTRMICKDIQLAAATYLLYFTCLPLIHLAAAFFLPK
jgi:hypothetical protein